MITRYFQLINELDISIFLLGARQTGKNNKKEAQINLRLYFFMI